MSKKLNHEPLAFLQQLGHSRHGLIHWPDLVRPHAHHIPVPGRVWAEGFQ